MKVISLPEIANQIRRRKGGKTFLVELINQCKIEDAIIIPDGATNGDMIKAMFPRNYTHIYDRSVSSWWNAPYKGNLSEKPTGSESEDKE